MKFEHVIQVNPHSDPSSVRLDRETLWLGVLYRAEDVRPFMPGVDECRIVERKENMLRRELYCGNLMIKDIVHYSAYNWISFESEATSGQTGGILTITIEEPERGDLYLRFSYVTTLDDQKSDEDRVYADFVRSAYYQADVEMVRIIRRMADQKSKH